MAHATGTAELDIAPAPAWSTAEFAEVYRAQFEFVWTQLRRLGVDESSLEDAAQEVFVVVYRRLDEFAGRAALRTWLFAIARRVAFRFRRSAARTSRRHQALARQPLAPAALDPEEAIRRGQARRMLAAFLQQLDDDKRAAFLLGELEGLGRVELGQALGVNPNTAYARLRAAREQFQRAFVSPRARAAILSDARAPAPPSAAQRHRVWLLVGLGLGAERALVATSTTAAATGGLKLLLAVGVLSVLSVLWIGTGRKGHVAGEPGRPPPADSSSPRVAPVPDAAGALADDGAQDRQAPRAGSTTVQPERREATRAARRARGKTGVDATVRETDEAQAPAEIAAEPASAPPVLRPRSREPASSSAPPTPASVPDAAPVAAEPALAADVRLLGEARRALASGTPAAALRLLTQHAAQFPASPLAATRRAMKVSALCRLGDTAGAQAEAAAFLRQHPDSGLAEQVRAGCDAPVP